jgi:hypothetical protein
MIYVYILDPGGMRDAVIVPSELDGITDMRDAGPTAHLYRADGQIIDRLGWGRWVIPQVGSVPQKVVDAAKKADRG